MVTCYGQAGTGKTLVAVAAGLHEMFNRRYNGLTVSRPRRKQQKKEALGDAANKPYDELIQRGIIEIEALCYIRGRSIPNRFFVLDEAQQLTPQEAKTVVTRMSRGSKLVMVGDPGQIDNPYVDSRSNGLVYTRNRLKGQPFAAHVTLARGERSPLAEAGAQLMAHRPCPLPHVSSVC